MPMFVQWKWMERTKTFLVISHFYDDYSEPNLRMKIKPYSSSLHHEHWKRIPWMTWAPSHLELGVLSELLGYANIVNGLKETEKRKLRNVLEGNKLLQAAQRAERNEPIDDPPIVYREDAVTNEQFLTWQLAPWYIEFLREKLKPYLKD